MFSSSERYRFHVEITDKCNAACPMCPRTDHLNFCRPDRQKVQKIDLTLADFEEHFTPEFCRQTAEVEFGGGLGDALAARDCLEICDHLTGNGVYIVISTNGGLRNEAWWQRLGEVCKRTGSKVELHVDGLRDTNPLYRVNTDFDKIMANARAYLDTGADAEWHYILFKHNEHQVAEARDLAAETGFSRFVLIDTIRFGSQARFSYQMPSGEQRDLEPPSRSSADFAALFGRPPDPAATAGGSSGEAAKDGEPAGQNGGAAGADVNGIRCKSQIKNRAYINCEGYVAACCWMSGSGEELRMYQLASPDKEDFNIRNRPLREILHGEPFASLYEEAWRAGENEICKRKCGSMIRNTRLAV